MAILQTTVNPFPRGRAVFELTPNPPMPPELVDTYVIRLWAHNHEEQPHFLSLVHTEMNIDWLVVSLAAARTKRFPELVHVHLYLRQAKTQVGEVRKGRSNNWGEWEEMISARIECTPQDAIEFGTQLREEIEATENQRILLGIPEYDASYYGEDVGRDSTT